MCQVENVTHVYNDGSRFLQPYHRLCHYSINSRPCQRTIVRDVGQQYLSTPPPWPAKPASVPIPVAHNRKARPTARSEHEISKAPDAASRETNKTTKNAASNSKFVQKCAKVKFDLYPFRTLSKKGAIQVKKDVAKKDYAHIKKVPSPVPEPPPAVFDSRRADSQKYRDRDKQQYTYSSGSETLLQDPTAKFVNDFSEFRYDSYKGQAGTQPQRQKAATAELPTASRYSNSRPGFFPQAGPPPPHFYPPPPQPPPPPPPPAPAQYQSQNQSKYHPGGPPINKQDQWQPFRAQSQPPPPPPPAQYQSQNQSQYYHRGPQINKQDQWQPSRSQSQPPPGQGRQPQRNSVSNPGPFRQTQGQEAEYLTYLETTLQQKEALLRTRTAQLANLEAELTRHLSHPKKSAKSPPPPHYAPKPTKPKHQSPSQKHQKHTKARSNHRSKIHTAQPFPEPTTDIHPSIIRSIAHDQAMRDHALERATASAKTARLEAEVTELRLRREEVERELLGWKEKEARERLDRVRERAREWDREWERRGAMGRGVRGGRPWTWYGGAWEKGLGGAKSGREREREGEKVRKGEKEKYDGGDGGGGRRSSWGERWA